MSPRLLVLMGSGETSPTMVKTHRELLSRLDGAPAVLLDTPFGFQANADDLTARAQAYFRDSVGAELALASYKSSAEIGSVGYECTLTQLREAAYVFAGPGSPTYALEQWRDSAVPVILRDKLVTGGCVTFASAAALTMGAVTVPVYEIYKVGAPAEWAEGLDLLRETGLSAAVIPHYNNAEGGNHDTRFCYLGEPRLQVMEQQLDESTFVLGIDEHTGLILDLDEKTATVVGIAEVTIRANGRSATFEPGTTLRFEELQATADALRDDEPPPPGGPYGGTRVGGTREAGGSPPGRTREGQDPRAAAGTLRAEINALALQFDEALAARETSAATQSILDLEQTLHAWSADTLQSDDLDHGRSTLRSMVTRLAALAESGAKDPRSVLGPFVDALLGLRDQARADKRYADADAVRDQLVALGIEVRDTAGGTEWELGGN
ncbi:MAG TPA: hypothetical protein VM143_03365 [Acidimicrobiales bacterium]|nr:hypothetical protein [Acidimicrobiales bacterium]